VICKKIIPASERLQWFLRWVPQLYYTVTCRAITSHVDVRPISGLGHISTFVRIHLSSHISNAYQSNRSLDCISLKSWILCVREKMYHSPHTKLINIGSKAIRSAYYPMYVVYLIPGLGLFMWWIWCEMMWNNVMSGGNHKKTKYLEKIFQFEFFWWLSAWESLCGLYSIHQYLFNNK
jgi:hypothetical protein